LNFVNRQWFLEGYYDVNHNQVHQRNSAAGFSPSGALMKAMLISGATPETNVTNEETTTYFKNSASFIQGYGSVRLGDTIWDENTIGDNYMWIASLQTNFSDALSYPGQDSTYCVMASNVQYDSTFFFFFPNTSFCRPAAFLKVTLVWFDYPASPASLISLVNNLDLELELNDIGYYANAMYSINPVTLEGEEVGYHLSSYK
jgi:hypothetical protein